MCSARRCECAEASGGGGGRIGSFMSVTLSYFGRVPLRRPSIAAACSMLAKAVLVTGAARRIGAAIAKCLHAAGAKVVVHRNRSIAPAEALAAELNKARAASCAVVRADLLDLDALTRLADDAQAAFGRLDAL